MQLNKLLTKECNRINFQLNAIELTPMESARYNIMSKDRKKFQNFFMFQIEYSF